MKKILSILVLTVITVSVKAQKAVYCDPSVSNLTITDLNNNPIDADRLTLNVPVKINCIVANTGGAIPKGTCKLKITLGSKFVLYTNIHGTNLPVPDHFAWDMKMGSSGHQAIIIADVSDDIPADFSQKISFVVMPSAEGTSTLTSQLLITNHGNLVKTLSDKESSNNAVSASYTVYKQFKPGFFDCFAKPASCKLNIGWSVNDESNIDHFEIETSADGSGYSLAQSVIPNGTKLYKAILDNITSKSLMVRIKAIATTGQVIYSEVLNVNEICSTKFEITLYPNPIAAGTNEVTLYTKSGLFNGKYNIRLFDAAGKEIKRTEEKYSNLASVKFNTGTIASGNYYIEVRAEDGQTSKLKFVKQ